MSGVERLRKAIRDQLLAKGVRNPLWLLAGGKTTDEALQETMHQLRCADVLYFTEDVYYKLRIDLECAARDLLDSNGGRPVVQQG
jgi:hypothetical protein